MKFNIPCHAIPAVIAAGLLSAISGPAFAQDSSSAGLLEALARNQLRAIVFSPVIVEAIAAQNAITSGYDQAKIDALDNQWRAESAAGGGPLIASLLGVPASQYLAEAIAGSGGLYTEIFVMDAKGLNVAQNEITSDYWQGDEDKWQQTFAVGPDAVHLGAVEFDESTQINQAQVSITVTDPATGAAIGAVTVGVDVSKL